MQSPHASSPGPHQSPPAGVSGLAIGLVATSIIALLTGIITVVAIIVFTPDRETSNIANEQLSQELSDAKLTIIAPHRTISSELGFSLSYEPTTLEVYGQVNDITSSTDTMIYYDSFENEELEQSRPYSMVTFRKQDAAIGAPSLTVSTNVRAGYWDRFRDESGFEDSKATLVAKQLTESYIDEYTTATEPEQVVIGDSPYIAVTITRDNTSYGVSASTETRIYVTVQNDRPYWATISNAMGDTSLTSQFEQIIASLVYTSFDQSLLGKTVSPIRLASTPAELPSSTSYVPEDLDTNSIIPVVLRNQPAVVRVLTVRCGVATLSDGNVRLELPRSCGAGVGSGSFISSDGYIATNGHVAIISDADLVASSLTSMAAVEDLLTFLVQSSTITDEQRAAFSGALQRGDSEAYQALAQLPSTLESRIISIHDTVYSYGIQTSNQPIRMQDDYSISYSDTVITAELVDSNYDPVTAARALRDGVAFTSSDIAILKAEGDFPAVTLAPTASLGQGNTMTAIGFPAFIDNATSTDQWQTVPTVTQGYVRDIISTGQTGGRIISATTQVSQGNSGGPAFDEQGRQAGLVTYAMMSCGDAQCFGNGSARDIGDLHDLVAKNNISLRTSNITTDWHEGLKAYQEGNYRQALEYFDAVRRDYPANYLVPELSRIARSNLGSASDTSDTIGTRFVIIIAAVSLSLLGLIIMVIATVILVRSHRTTRAGSTTAP